MVTTSRVTAMALLLSLAVAGLAHAGEEGRIHGTITDPEGKPIPKVSIVITTPDLEDFEVRWESNKKGRYAGLLGDATLRYQFRFEKEGYRTIVEGIQLDIGGTIRRDFTLYPGIAGAAPDAASQAQAAAEAASAAAVTTYNEGATALRAGDLDTARERFQAALKKDPGLAPAYGALARIHVEKGEHQEALDAAEKALELRPLEPMALQARYDAYNAMGDKDNAKEAAEALSAAGQSAEAAKRIFNEGVAATKEGNAVEALAKFERAADLDPNLLQAHDALAGLYFDQQKFARAAAAAERVLELDSQNEKALRIRFEAYRALGDTEKVEESLSGLATVDPSMGAEALFEQAIQLFNAGDMDGARALFERVTTLQPDHARAHYRLALCHVNAGNSAAAKQHFERFLALAPDDPDAATAKEMMKYL